MCGSSIPSGYMTMISYTNLRFINTFIIKLNLKAFLHMYMTNDCCMKFFFLLWSIHRFFTLQKFKNSNGNIIQIIHKQIDAIFTTYIPRFGFFVFIHEIITDTMHFMLFMSICWITNTKDMWFRFRFLQQCLRACLYDEWNFNLIFVIFKCFKFFCSTWHFYSAIIHALTWYFM